MRLFSLFVFPSPVLFLLLAVAGLSALPFVRLLLTALGPGFWPALTTPAALAAMAHTLEVALLGMVGALAIGTAAAVLLTLTDLPGRRLLGLALLLPLMIAPQVTALAWLSTFGAASPLLKLLHLAPAPGSRNPLLGRDGIILLYSVQHAPLVFLTVRAGLRAIPRDLMEAALLAGASPWRVVAGIVLPLARPYLVAAGALAFVSGVGNFGIPALLGLPVNYTTLPTLIYQKLASAGPRVLPDAAALSMAVAAVAGVGVVIQALAFGRRGAPLPPGEPLAFALGGWRWPLAGGVWVLVGVGLLLPLAGLLAAAVVPTFGVPLTWATVTLDNFIEVLIRQSVTARAFRNSFLLAGGAALMLGVGAVVLARGLTLLPPRAARVVEGLAEMPYALPGIVLAIACILVFLKPLPLVGVSLYATPWIILFAYAARFLPLALKPVAAALTTLPREQEEAAQLLGAGPWRRLATIIAPGVLPAAVAGAILVFLSAFNELTVSALLWSAGTETLGVVLYNLEDGGYGTLSAAVAVVTVAVVVAGFALLDRLGRHLPAGARM